MKKKIAIIGAGISGLVFANFLRKESKYNFSLYERNNSIDLNQGYGVQLAVNSINILNKIGFQSFKTDEKFNPKKIDFYSIKKNNKICALDISQFNSQSAHYTSLKRSSLIEFLKENLFTNTIQFNKKIKKINFLNSKIEINFEDNFSDVVDYLIISDGIFSSTKLILFDKNVQVNYYGALAIRATLNIKVIKFLDQNNISVFLGPGFHFVIYPLNKKNEFNFIAINLKKSNQKYLNDFKFFEDQNKLKKILDEVLINQNDNFKEIVNNAKNLKCFPIFCSDKIHKPNQNNVFVLGDALFASPPSFAQGASQSIEAAYELFKILNEDNNNNGFNKYYKNRINRIKMINRRSKLNYYVFHLSNPLMVLIRNIILKIIVINRRFLNKYLGKIYLKK